MSQSPFYAPVPPFAPQSAKSRLSLWCLSIGVASLVFSWVPLLGLLVGLVAIVLSAVALAKVVSKTKAGIGLGLGIVALAINVIVIAALGSAVPSHVNAAATVPSIATPAADPTVEATKAPTVDPTMKPTVGPTAERSTVAPTTEAAPPVVTHTTKSSNTEAMSVEEQNAIRSAQSYLEISAFSRKGLIRQLSSDAGDGYSVRAATFAVDYLHIDFNEQAYKSALNYLKISGFSRAGLMEQLESDAGEGFTHSQAVYAVNKVGL